MQYTVHTYVLKQQYSLRYQHQKVGMQFVSITIDMLQIPEKLLLLHRILSSCAKRICVARCLKLSLLLLKQIFTRKLEEFLSRKIVGQITSFQRISSIFTDCFDIVGFNILFSLLHFVMSTIVTDQSKHFIRSTEFDENLSQ